jgi:uncharacterized hydrophobic protein (TIGR00271 family)
MIHVRAVSPSRTTPILLEELDGAVGVLNLIVLPDAAKNPDGDSVQFDVITAEANRVLARLRRLELDRHGSIMIEPVETAISDLVDRAEGRGPPGQEFSPIWDQVDARIRAMGRYPPSWFMLLTIAGLIATVGILTNSQILIVGAMIVGPEYGAVASIALGITNKERASVGRGLSALATGFAAAIVACFVFGLIVRGFGLQPRAYSLGIRPVADLINNPNFFSVVVAVLAGVVGVLSLTESRAATLIGVFVSVTTIPAAADLGLSTAFSSWPEARGSLFQLLLNLGLLIVVGAAVLLLQRRIWRRISAGGGRLPLSRFR